MPMPTTFAPLPAADPVFRRAHGAGADTPHSELPTRLDTGSPAAHTTACADSEPVGCLPPGTKLRQFVIERVLGEGGFGVVYSAYDLALGRRVAIKEYMPAAFAVRRADFSVQVRSSSEKQAAFAIGLKSFVNEARLLAQLDHPALAKVFQFWSERGTAYFVMPYYTSPTLASWLRQRWGGDPQNAPIDEAWLQRYLLGALDALSFLHGKSCLHRDLSPQNLLVVNDADPLLLDFGAARRVVGAHTASLTAILKPGYAPLEQYDGNTLKQGPWTDLYALAAVMYHAMVGTPPPAAVERVVQASGRSNAPGTASSIHAALAQTPYSRPFIAAIELALALHPRHRPQSAEELASLIRSPAAVPPAPASAAARPATLAATRPPTLVRSRIPTLNVPLPMAPPPSNAPVNVATTAVPAQSPRKAGALALAAAAIVAISAAGLAIWPPTSGEPLSSGESAITAEAPRSSRTAATDPALELPAKAIGSALSEPVSVLDEGRASPSTVGDSTTPIGAARALPAASDVSAPSAGGRKTAAAIASAPVQAKTASAKAAESRPSTKPQAENRKSNDGASSAPKAAAAAAAPTLPPLLTAYSPAAETPRAPATATSEPPATAAPAAGDGLRALARPTPAYPAEALRDGIHNGRVLASFVVNPDGSVSGIQIVSAAPARAFDRAVRSALAQWRFAPVAAVTPASVEFAFDVNR